MAWRCGARIVFILAGKLAFFTESPPANMVARIFETYIIGTVGNEKFSITAGYLRQESADAFRAGAGKRCLELCLG